MNLQKNFISLGMLTSLTCFLQAADIGKLITAKTKLIAAQDTLRAKMGTLNGGVIKNGSFEVSYEFTDKWDKGYKLEFTIKNITSAKTEGWALDFDFATDDQKMNNVWGGDKDSAASTGTHVKVLHPSWYEGGFLNPGQAATVGMIVDKNESTVPSIKNIAAIVFKRTDNGGAAGADGGSSDRNVEGASYEYTNAGALPIIFAIAENGLYGISTSLDPQEKVSVKLLKANSDCALAAHINVSPISKWATLNNNGFMIVVDETKKLSLAPAEKGDKTITNKTDFVMLVSITQYGTNQEKLFLNPGESVNCKSNNGLVTIIPCVPNFYKQDAPKKSASLEQTKGIVDFKFAA